MIQSLQRAFGILCILDEADDPQAGLGAQEIATAAGLKFPTAHNFLKSLVALGYVERVTDSGRYRVTAALARLGTGGGRLRRLGRVAEAHAASAAVALGETVVVVAEKDLRRVLLCSVESTQDLRVSLSPKEGPLDWEKPTTRVIASGFDAGRLDGFLRLAGYPGSAWDGITTRPRLEEALSAIRSRGWARVREESAGVVSLAVPIVDPAGLLHAALGCFMPASRFRAPREAGMAGILVRTAAAIGADLAM